MTRFCELRRKLVELFADAGIQSAAVDADLLISELAGVPRSELFFLADRPVPPALEKKIREQDSILRMNVTKEEQFQLSLAEGRNLHIEGMHFFCPLKGVISQGYDPSIHPFIDITAPANSMVYAVLDGTVIASGWNDDSGYTIQIQHVNDIISIYKHNQKLLRKVGDKVTAGEPIAIVGNTGTLTTGEHLHFELWYRGEAVDPTKYINF